MVLLTCGAIPLDVLLYKIEVKIYCDTRILNPITYLKGCHPHLALEWPFCITICLFSLILYKIWHQPLAHSFLSRSTIISDFTHTIFLIRKVMLLPQIYYQYWIHPVLLCNSTTLDYCRTYSLLHVMETLIWQFTGMFI